MRASAGLALAVLVSAPCALASSGDRIPGFQHCLSHCTATSCPTPWARPRQSLALRLTNWSCEDDCKYTCMHALTDAALAPNSKDTRIHQYYGKWPFWRYMGAQEPASVVFSLLNLAGHAYGLRRVRREVAHGHPMRPFLLMFAYVGLNAWIWSAIFHTRDKPWTERMDYFSAAASIMYGFFMACVRVFGLYPPMSRTRLTSGYVQHRNDRTRPLAVLALLCGVLYALHVLYLSTAPLFDYGYNMRASVAIGMLHNVVWLLYSSSPPFPTLRLFPARTREYRPPYASKPLIAVTLTMLAMSLELLDFPPWRRVLDAHALWHLATAPIVVYWYGFLVQDAKDAATGSYLDCDRRGRCLKLCA